ncbi:ABC transporter permease subunit [Aeromicrobium sp. 636]|uniref:ABC transporter permease subunit n=1 Tax=Aeromicrobium senzhongii TaxID=2663859 RepID=A0A8I0K261_9ACTN|nr:MULTISPECIES: ABC transporter permease subunit [Aeromicrobium]MBC9225819.1 ABC transporter permease subunit [Aeromicrobium senzhongii]MCQ3997927.1 ABC transporter permease subunit [Aeromicrobium sp. 636]MTB87855.1 ABC transporter permease subunit [Aeromicrobium senzhongii]QNL95124.1 ABC transporter permease subunit [Aeromicrobium senzhongii]
MSTAIKAELRKLFSTRLWWLLALVLVAYLVFIAVVISFSFTVDMGDDSVGMPVGEELARVVYSLTSPIGYVFPLIVGSLLFTGEFRHKTITASLLAQPNRSVLMAAKLVAAVVVGLIYGVIGTLSTVAGAAPVLAWRGDGAYLGAESVLVLLGMSVLVMTIWAVLGTAIGSVLTNQVAAIIVILAFTQFVEPIARVALGAWDATSEVAKYLPGAAADAVLGSSFFAQDTTTDLLSRGPGAIVLLAYVVVFVLLGRFVTLRRDIG